MPGFYPDDEYDLAGFVVGLADNEELRVRLGAEASAGPVDVVLDPGVFQAAYARSAPVTPEEVGGTLGLGAALDGLIRIVAPALGGALMDGLGTPAPSITSW